MYPQVARQSSRSSGGSGTAGRGKPPHYLGPSDVYPSPTTAAEVQNQRNASGVMCTAQTYSPGGATRAVTAAAPAPPRFSRCPPAHSQQQQQYAATYTAPPTIGAAANRHSLSPATPSRTPLQHAGGGGGPPLVPVVASTRHHHRPGRRMSSTDPTSALAAVRNSHRLRHPADAFQLHSVAESSPPAVRQQARKAKIGGVEGADSRMATMTARDPRVMDTAERRQLFLSRHDGNTSGGSNDGTCPVSSSLRAAGKSTGSRTRQGSSLLSSAPNATGQAEQHRRDREESQMQHAKRKAARLAHLQAHAEEWTEALKEQLAELDSRDMDDDDGENHCNAQDGYGDGDGDGATAEEAERRLRRLLAAYRLQQRQQKESKEKALAGGGGGGGGDGGEWDGERHQQQQQQQGEEEDDNGGLTHQPFLASLSTLSDSTRASAAGSGDDDDRSSATEEEEETLQDKMARLERRVISHYATLYTQRTTAAAVIQRAWRCSRARLALYNRRQLLYQYMYVQQKAAAICIVGVLKARVLQRRRQAALAQCAVREAARAAWERAALQAVAVIERAVKAWLLRRQEQNRLLSLLGLAKDARLQRYAVAAVLVQRWWRIVPAQRAYWQRRGKEVAEQRARQEEESRRQAAATVLQKRVRGILGRRAFYAYRATRRQELAERQQRLQQCTDVVRLTLREYHLRRQRIARETEMAVVEKDEAAAMIQRGWKQALIRRRLQTAIDEARRQHNGATVLQRAWRRYLAGRELRYLRSLHETVERERLAGEFTRYHAAVCLQRFARGVVLRRARERTSRAAHGRHAFTALVLLQAVGRGLLCRRRMGISLHGTRLAERARVAREAVQRTTSASTAEAILAEVRALYVAFASAAAHEAEIAELRVRARHDMVLDGHATTIQNAVRRWLQRRRRQQALEERVRAMGFLAEAAACLQRWWRGVLARRVVALRQAARQRETRKRLEWEDVVVALLQDSEAEAETAAAAERHAKLHAPAERGEGVLGGPRGGESHCPAPTAAAWAGLYDDDDDDDEAVTDMEEEVARGGGMSSVEAEERSRNVTM